MKVTVRHFAMLREHRGSPEEDVEIRAETTVSELFASLFPSHAELPVMYAVNREYVEAGWVLKAGDEVAYIPPLGGG